ncbi:NTP transferase domain-containing protein [Anaerophilus nitritogenes]|uniref:NTP transferase domain-containing protein n=1 Tax=Anaerophilus nitritogenes TaxID=2498136 RepID=UPI00101DD13F|nr:NTP transferase domain-containing protein [Anaerophilus nitritogenes]
MNSSITDEAVKTIDHYKVDNAIIMAAGISSRFAPISYEYPKALLNVKGEVSIERQIRQLKEAGIHDITVVVGYRKELFYYLKDKYDVNIVENPEYNVRNNNSTLYYVKDILSNTYICSADNYFTVNVFDAYVQEAYYSAVFQKGETNEWCIKTDDTGLITDVVVGGSDSWIMLGHAFFSQEFSKKFVEILERIYDNPETKPLLWEGIYTKHINELPMYIRKYSKEIIFEFDTLDELRTFDNTYWDCTRSKILQQVCQELKCKERDILKAKPLNINGETIGFTFITNDILYKYLYSEKVIRIEED